MVIDFFLNSNYPSLATNPSNEADLEASDIQNESSRRNAGASESESQLLANMNFENLGGNHISDETCLSEDQALRELNNSRSRWGPSSGSGNNNNLNKKKSRSIEKVIDCDLRRRCVICLNSIINWHFFGKTIVIVADCGKWFEKNDCKTKKLLWKWLIRIKNKS